MIVYPEASVHGRFQPFHNEHLEYVLAAQRRCKFLWIGITKCDIRPITSGVPPRFRERAENNPLTFFERTVIITEALVEAAVDRSRFDLIPFPIEEPERLAAYLPTTVPCFTTICEEWNREKIDILSRQGYDVHILWERKGKKIRGTAIRGDILRGGTAWKQLVPAATVRAVERLNLAQRLAVLAADSESQSI